MKINCWRISFGHYFRNWCFAPLQSSEVQSGEEIMQYGKSIDDGQNTQGVISRLLSARRLDRDVYNEKLQGHFPIYRESKQDILGKVNDVVFCGRILMFLAHFFPLSERSGLSVDFNFYKTFWSLQEYFCNPASLTLAPVKWQKFTASLTVVLNTFEARPLSDEDGDAIILEEDAATFDIKYLTSSNLMGLELNDPSFQHHILVQCLILFDYVKAPGKNDKDSSETMKEELKSCEVKVKKLLEMTPPKGKEFLCSIEHILERENNWNAFTDPQCVRTPAITEYWKPLAEDMDESARIEAEYHNKNNRGLSFSARQDLEGFSRFTEHGIEGVVPFELLPPDIQSKFQDFFSRETSKQPRASRLKLTFI